MNNYCTFTVSSVDPWEPRHDWCLTLLCSVVIPLFYLVRPWNVGKTGQLFLIYRHRQILACWVVLHGLAEACVLIIDTRHILGSLRILSRHPVCVVWVGGGGSGGMRFGHANEFMGDWLIKEQAGSWPDFVFEMNIIVCCRSDMMTKSIWRLVLIEAVTHRDQNYDKGFLMTDFVSSWVGAVC